MINKTHIINFLGCSCLVVVGMFICALGAFLVFDFDGWGKTLLDFLVAWGFQISFGIIFTAAILYILQFIHISYGESYISLFILEAIFIAGSIMALPIIILWQSRSPDFFDILMTFLSITASILAIILFRLAANLSSQASPDDPKPYDLPQRPTPAETKKVAHNVIKPSASPPPAPPRQPVQQAKQPPKPAIPAPTRENPEQSTATSAKPQSVRVTPPRPPVKPAPKPTSPGEKTNDPEVIKAYQELIQRVHGDEAVAKRLAEFEQKNSPNGTPLSWIQDAIRRLYDDQ